MGPLWGGGGLRPCTPRGSAVLSLVQGRSYQSKRPPRPMWGEVASFDCCAVRASGVSGGAHHRLLVPTCPSWTGSDAACPGGWGALLRRPARGHAHVRLCVVGHLLLGHCRAGQRPVGGPERPGHPALCFQVLNRGPDAVDSIPGTLVGRQSSCAIRSGHGSAG